MRGIVLQLFDPKQLDFRRRTKQMDFNMKTLWLLLESITSIPVPRATVLMERTETLCGWSLPHHTLIP